MSVYEDETTPIKMCWKEKYVHVHADKAYNVQEFIPE